MTTLQATRLVIGRELRAKLRDKAFIFSTVSFLVILVASIAIPAMLESGPTKVAVTDSTYVEALQRAGLEVQQVSDPAAAEQLVRDGDVEAAVVAGPTVVALEDSPDEVVEALSTSPPVQLLDAPPFDPALTIFVPLLLAMLCYITSLLFGLQIAQSVVEEKQTRIVEILVASIPTRALLAGKVVAMTLLAFAQIALLAVIALVGTTVTDLDAGLLDALRPTLGWFLPFFVLGFIMLAAIWAGTGALAARQEDLGSTSGTVQMVVLIPFFAVLFLRDNAAALQFLSYFPFSSPMAMPIRIFQGDAAGWEPFVALAILAGTAVLLLAVGARIYEGSLLRTNTRTSMATAWRSRSTVS
ncbi:ABC transporter permease [Actinoplanes aureus]|uniref:ABC transporter permease n=1 Tax=Actinoplanes aureus TaxID=2792083 RepID=A0A931FV53_9ACTN|nr:ABC transporter permease [Actinoplanes aureus]MBG0559875.1 ABC transporter permease [Actinoplanes aureus]